MFSSVVFTLSAIQCIINVLDPELPILGMEFFHQLVFLVLYLLHFGFKFSDLLLDLLCLVLVWIQLTGDIPVLFNDVSDVSNFLFCEFNLHLLSAWRIWILPWYSHTSPHLSWLGWSALWVWWLYHLLSRKNPHMISSPWQTCCIARSECKSLTGWQSHSSHPGWVCIRSLILSVCYSYTKNNNKIKDFQKMLYLY